MRILAYACMRVCVYACMYACMRVFVVCVYARLVDAFRVGAYVRMCVCVYA